MNKYLCCLILLLLAGCSSPTEVIAYRSVPLDIKLVGKPPALDLMPVNFMVIGDRVSLSVSDYENLSYNLNSITGYIEKQNSIITYYENMVRRVSGNDQQRNQ